MILVTDKERFYELVSKGYRIIKLYDTLTPVNTGWNKKEFVYESEYTQNQNYGVVGESLHKSTNGQLSKIIFVDFDIKEKYTDDDGIKHSGVIPEAKTILDDILKQLIQKNVYLTKTKSGGSHLGILTNEKIAQTVSFMIHSKCEKLKIDIRTGVGYVVAIAPNYKIQNIPKIFDHVDDLQTMLESFGFIKNKNSITSGSLTDLDKKNARIVLDTIDVSKWPDLGTSNISTHDVITFWTMSCRARNIPLEDTVEKIMCILDQFEISKNNENTRREIMKLYNKEYDDFIQNESKKKLHFHYSDTEGISKQIMKEINIVTLKSKEILYWKNGTYRFDGELLIQPRIRELADVGLNGIREILGYIRDKTGYYNLDQFDSDPHIVNLKEGLLDLKTGKISDHDPEYLSITQIPIKYDQYATCPRFEKFLKSSLNDDKNIHTIYEMIALCLIKDNSLIQKAFIHIGSGSNGKSKLFEIIIAFLGKGNVSSANMQRLENNRFALAGLIGKLANISADISSEALMQTSNHKMVIAGDRIVFEKKNKDGVSGVAYATLIYSANELPIIHDGSDGFARRFVIIDWPNSFYGEKRDKTIQTIQYDESELSGILNKVILIAKDLLQTHSLKYEKTVANIKKEWEEKSDSPKRFITETMYIDYERTCPVALVRSQYTKFCITHKMTPLSPKSFNFRMNELGYEQKGKKINGDNIQSWFGFTLKSEKRFLNQSLT